MKCACGCCHVPDHGACPTYECRYARCFYCDHAEACHERDKHKAAFNTPLGVGFRDPKLAKLHEELLVAWTDLGMGNKC